ncbi:9118_t:CDS:2 [Paraglomus brasilianum]|uniref:9118_t:CDS:1 n=1 Tax=Paraglomus brasilianum TaxID=144538 RepID=A0A9N9APD8_9GLOM|nr:9118_t:CDS:2 [Paraglomus brasilianum]
MSSLACFWALLSLRDLTFVYISPSLRKTLGVEYEAVLGTSFFEYFHPDEEEFARHDLSEFVKKDSICGSVTRCQYNSVLAIRAKAQSRIYAARRNSPVHAHHAQPSSPNTLPIENRYVIMNVGMDIVTQDIVLARFHADEGSQAENGMKSNTCGESEFTKEELTRLTTLLRNHVTSESINIQSPPATPQSLPPHPVMSVPRRIFQILDTRTRNLIFTWPDPHAYNKEEFSKLIQGVAMQPSTTSTSPACICPYSNNHVLSLASGMFLRVDSVMIHYGEIIFASFKILPSSPAVLSIDNPRQPSYSAPCSPLPAVYTGKRPRTENSSPAYGPQMPVPSLSFLSRGRSHEHTGDTELYEGESKRRAVERRQGLTTPQFLSPHESPQMSPHQIYGQYPFPSFPNITTIDINTSPPPQPSSLGHTHQQILPASQSPSHSSQPPQSSRYVQSLDRGYALQPFNSSSSPPVRPYQLPSTNSAIRSNHRVPDGVRECERCHTTNSPEWRRGPTGHKTLCNACGLRYSRKIARDKRREQAHREEQQRERREMENVNVNVLLRHNNQTEPYPSMNVAHNQIHARHVPPSLSQHSSHSHHRPSLQHRQTSVTHHSPYPPPGPLSQYNQLVLPSLGPPARMGATESVGNLPQNEMNMNHSRPPVYYRREA